MQGLRLAAITDFEKAKLQRKICQSQWTMKYRSRCVIEGYVKDNQWTNGPVNAHLRSAVCTNVIENSPSIGADEALGPFFFPE